MRRLWISLLLAMTLLVAVVPSAMAIEYRQGNAITVGKTETIEDDLIVSGSAVTIDGTVNGDVFAFAQTVVVNGTINGNLFAAARVVDVKGTISGTAATAGQQVLVQGRIERNLVAAGSTVTLLQSGSVGRSLIGAGDTVEQYGAVERGVAVAGSKLMIAGRVGREVRAASGSLDVASTAVVKGPLTYWSNSAARIAAGSQVGEVRHEVTAGNTTPDFGPWYRSPWLIGLKFGGFLIVGLALLALFPRLRASFPSLIIRKPWQAPLAGFLALIAIPIAAVILMITVIGAPLGIVTVLLYPVMIYTGQVLVAWAAGRLLADRVPALRAQNWAVLFLLGALITTVLTQLPIVGVGVTVAALLYGMGGLWFTATERREAM
jgi:cytoskeletal protein CcmA (bactofilin family)